MGTASLIFALCVGGLPIPLAFVVVEYWKVLWTIPRCDHHWIGTAHSSHRYSHQCAKCAACKTEDGFLMGAMLPVVPVFLKKKVGVFGEKDYDAWKEMQDVAA